MIIPLEVPETAHRFERVHAISHTACLGLEQEARQANSVSDNGSSPIFFKDI
jgi:hypothetical protein